VALSGFRLVTAPMDSDVSREGGHRWGIVALVVAAVELLLAALDLMLLRAQSRGVVLARRIGAGLSVIPMGITALYYVALWLAAKPWEPQPVLQWAVLAAALVAEVAAVLGTLQGAPAAKSTLL
jgi:hypothetical protein